MALKKKLKAEVKYSKGMNEQRCRNCEHYKPLSRTCLKVDGTIDPEYWCRLFKEHE